MTTAATVMGHFPLVLATGPGAGARNSIGIMLVSGMIVGSAFTLFVVPSIYVLVARNHAAVPAEEPRDGRRRRAGRRNDDMNGIDFARAGAYALGLVLTVTSASAQVPPPGGGGRPAQAAAPDTLRLTLEDAVDRAIDHNPDLALVRLDTEAAAATVGESRSAFTPEFSTTLGRSSQTTPPSNFLLGDHGVDAKDWFSSTGIRQRLPWGGGTWNVSWDASRTTSNDPLTSFDPSLQSGLMVAFSQPLLKDRELDAARHQYIIARRDQQSSELQLQESVVQTVAAVKAAYWTLKAARANVTVQQRSLELAQELVRQSQARVDVGQAPPLDLVQAQAEVAQRRDNLIRATSAAGDAEDDLRRLIMDPVRRVVLADAPRPGGRAGGRRRRRQTWTRRSPPRSPGATIWRALATTWRTPPPT